MEEALITGSPAARDGTPAADDPGRPDPTLLAAHVHARLRELGTSVNAAAKRGGLSRATLAKLGKDGSVPGHLTLTKLDALLLWAPGSARAALYGDQPVARDPDTDRDTGRFDTAAYERLATEIDTRLRELNLSRSKIAKMGGPGRTTLATLGRRGFVPNPDTLARLEQYLLWAPGSAVAVLSGGSPVRTGRSVAPHPSLVPLNIVQDRLRKTLAQISRHEQALAQMKADVTDSISHVRLAIQEIERTGLAATPPDPASDKDSDPDPGAS